MNETKRMHNMFLQNEVGNHLVIWILSLTVLKIVIGTESATLPKINAAKDVSTTVDSPAKGWQWTNMKCFWGIESWYGVRLE